jgi:predicted TIM-barrel fold metal-dependent hydrolase
MKPPSLPQRRRRRRGLLVGGLATAALAVAVGFVVVGRGPRPGGEVRRDAGAEPLESRFRVIDVHEHLESLAQAPVLLAAMDALSIEKTVLMGSSRFTLTLDPNVGFTGYDENNEELLKTRARYPGRFEVWPTIRPDDPQSLAKLEALVARGASGLKLYAGHGFVNPHTGEYLFHTVALDDPRLLPIYRYCEQRFIPVCLHVQTSPDKGPGIAEELVAVLTQFPNLKVVVPHFMLAANHLARVRELLDTFPNLYSDVSFGDNFALAGLRRIAKAPAGFRRLFADYPTRFMFAADLVVTRASFKTADWVRVRLESYLDMLLVDRYTVATSPDEPLTGLALPAEINQRVLHQNFRDFTAQRPAGTLIRRPLRWSEMGVVPTGRKPGAMLPPPIGRE